MFPDRSKGLEEGGKTIDWVDLVSTMHILGFAAEHRGGSAFTFRGAVRLPRDPSTPQKKSISVHMPHPSPELGPISLQSLGRRRNRRFGWQRANFATEERGVAQIGWGFEMPGSIVGIRCQPWMDKLASSIQTVDRASLAWAEKCVLLNTCHRGPRNRLLRIMTMQNTLKIVTVVLYSQIILNNVRRCETLSIQLKHQAIPYTPLLTSTPIRSKLLWLFRPSIHPPSSSPKPIIFYLVSHHLPS